MTEQKKQPGEVGLPVVPDGSEPWDKGGQLTGMRAWRLVHRDGHWRLSALVHESVWPRGVFEAKCGASRSHVSPDAECSCGVYSFWTHAELAKQERWRPLIAGSVLAWGKVLPGELGFKAQKVMPLSLEHPQCLGYESAALWPRARCDRAADQVVAFPLWQGDFRYQGHAKESRATMQWVDKSVRWACDEHVSEEMRRGYGEKCSWKGCQRKVRQDGFCLEHAPFVVSADEVMSEVASWYEVDVMPLVHLEFEEE